MGPWLSTRLLASDVEGMAAVILSEDCAGLTLTGFAINALIIG